MESFPSVRYTIDISLLGLISLLIAVSALFISLKSYLNQSKNTISCIVKELPTINGYLPHPFEAEEFYLRYRDYLATMNIRATPRYICLNCYKEGESNFNNLKLCIHVKMKKKTPWSKEGIQGINRYWEIPIGRLVDDLKICIANVGAIYKGHIDWKAVAQRADSSLKVVRKGKLRIDNTVNLVKIEVHQLNLLNNNQSIDAGY